MIAAYRDFLPEVLPYVRDCSEPAAVAAIRHACIYFCQNSLAWRVEQDATDVIAGEASYAAEPPSGADAQQVLHAWFAGRELTPIGLDELSARFGADWRDQRGTPVSYSHVAETNEVRLVPCPDISAAGALKLIIACTPNRKSTGMDAAVMNRYAEVLSWGARARLHDVPNQPYYDPNTSSLLHSRFFAGTKQAARDAQRSFTRAPGKISPQRFA